MFKRKSSILDFDVKSEQSDDSMSSMSSSSSDSKQTNMNSNEDTIEVRIIDYNLTDKYLFLRFLLMLLMIRQQTI